MVLSDFQILVCRWFWTFKKCQFSDNERLCDDLKWGGKEDLWCHLLDYKCSTLGGHCCIFQMPSPTPLDFFPQINAIFAVWMLYIKTNQRSTYPGFLSRCLPRNLPKPKGMEKSGETKGQKKWNLFCVQVVKTHCVFLILSREALKMGFGNERYWVSWKLITVSPKEWKSILSWWLFSVLNL